MLTTESSDMMKQAGRAAGAPAGWSSPLTRTILEVHQEVIK